MPNRDLIDVAGFCSYANDKEERSSKLELNWSSERGGVGALETSPEETGIKFPSAAVNEKKDNDQSLPKKPGVDDSSEEVALSD